MVSKFNYVWRLMATGCCFIAFGAGALVLSVLVFPLMHIFPSPKKALRARWVIHKAFGLFLGLMEAAQVMRLEVIGGEKLRDCANVLVLANHPSLIDVVALVSLMPNASCVVKQALWNNPFMAGVVRAANYISNREPTLLIEDCATDLQTCAPLLIFPEGTRSEPGQPMRFKRGAAYIALHSNVPILPVLIYCKPTTLTKQEKWYNIPNKKVHLLIRVLEPVSTSQWINPEEPPAIAVRKLTRSLEEYFTQELSIHGSTTS